MTEQSHQEAIAVIIKLTAQGKIDWKKMRGDAIYRGTFSVGAFTATHHVDFNVQEARLTIDDGVHVPTAPNDDRHLRSAIDAYLAERDATTLKTFLSAASVRAGDA